MPVGFWRNVKFDKAQLADEYCRSFGLCVPAAMTEANRGFVHEFARYLESTARELVVTEIAEEFSRDALDKSNSTYCTAREVATKLGIAHCFVTLQPRNECNIPNTDVRREEFWLTRLSGSKEEDILFICRDDHIESFSNRLTMADYPNKILSRRWGFELQDPEVYWANT